MSGFVIRCNDCGSEIKTVEYHQFKGDKISVYLNEKRKGTKYNQTDVLLWCETCDNSVVFKDLV